jgi:hypothetical protein
VLSFAEHNFSAFASQLVETTQIGREIFLTEAATSEDIECRVSSFDHDTQPAAYDIP